MNTDKNQISDIFPALFSFHRASKSTRDSTCTENQGSLVLAVLNYLDVLSGPSPTLFWVCFSTFQIILNILFNIKHAIPNPHSDKLTKSPRTR